MFSLALVTERLCSWPNASAGHIVEPVGSGGPQLIDVLRGILGDRTAELRRIQHRREPGHGRGGEGAAVFHLRSHTATGRRRTRLGGDDHHAIGSVGPVNRRCRRVAQDGDVLDVIRVEEVQRVATGGESAPGAATNRHAVDDIERLAARIDRGRAADPDRLAAAGFVVVNDLDARGLARDEFHRRYDAAGVELLGGDRGDGAGDVAGPLLAVACHHQFGERDSLGGHGDIRRQVLACPDVQGPHHRRVAEVARPEGVGACADVEKDVAAIRSGQHGAAACRDTHTDQRLLRRVVGV